MAYLNFNEAGFAAATRSGQAARPDPAASFSALEWLVIALAERDSLASLRQPGRLARAMGALFGRSDARPLARPRLEALRRLAVLARHHGQAVRPAELAAFTDAGFSADQADVLIASVAGRRAGRLA